MSFNDLNKKPEETTPAPAQNKTDAKPDAAAPAETKETAEKDAADKTAANDATAKSEKAAV